jgi:hypothetical protein
MIASDVELAVYKWAKGNVRISAVTAGQIHFFVPGQTPPFPLLTIESAGGPASFTEAQIQETIITLACWAKKNDKASSAKLASVVMTEAFKLYRGPVTVDVPGALVTLQGANPGGAIWFPDPDAGYARHVVSATFTTTAIATA